MKLEGHTFGISAVQWHKNGETVVSIGDIHDLQVFLWNIKLSGIRIAVSRIPAVPKKLLFLNDFHFLAVGKGMVRIWDYPINPDYVIEKSLLVKRDVLLG